VFSVRVATGTGDREGSREPLSLWLSASVSVRGFALGLARADHQTLGRALVQAPGRQVFAAIKSVAIDRRSLSRQNPTADLGGEAEEVFDS
jgi:hypothetical protein